MRKLTVNTGGMSRPPKPAQQAKRVAPPAVPDIYRHSGSSFGSAGYGSCEETAANTSVGGYYSSVSIPETSKTAPITLPVTVRSTNNQNINSDKVDYANAGAQPTATGLIIGGGNLANPASGTTMQSKSPGAGMTSGGSSSGVGGQGTFIFPTNHHQHQPLTHKAAVYYHQQLALQEDQGIDLTQSPGRDSPGSSSGSAGSGSRHSTASLDSGRASSYHTGASTSSTSTRNGANCLNNANTGCNISSGGSSSISSAGGVLSSPRCSSVSSCSIGSVDRMCQRTDHEIITDWLRELCFEEYAPLFSAAGYDMPTISRMTPEDLTAIGIKKPRHRERIKQHIDALQLPDNLPHIVPGSIEEWLCLLRLDEYIQPLLAQGYQTVRDVTQLPWEDMEDIGIVKLGHQKKLLLAIKRIKDIMSGKWISPGITHSPQECLAQQQLNVAWDLQQHTNYIHHMNPHHPPPSPLLSPLTTSQHYQQHQQMMSHSAIMEKDSSNDIVLIKLRQPRGKSLESLEDPDENRLSGTTHLTFTTGGSVAYHPQHSHYSSGGALHGDSSVNLYRASIGGGQYQMVNKSNLHQMPWRRSYDDGDITPTNEVCILGSGGLSNISCGMDQGGGTLPRHRSSSTNISSAQRPRPIAKVIGNVSMSLQQQQQQLLSNSADFVNEKNAKSYGMHCGRPMMGSPTLIIEKKQAPEPPRRHCSTGLAVGSNVNCSAEQISEHFDAITLSSQHPLYHHSKSYNSPHHHYPQTQYMHQQIHPQYIAANNCHVSHNAQHQPIYANYNVVTQHHMQKQQPPTQMQTTVEVHVEKQPASANDSKSNSSIDSIDALPFANDNAGTIKQRAMGGSQYHQSHNGSHLSTSEIMSNCNTITSASNFGSTTAAATSSSLSSSSSSSSSLATTVAVGGQGSGLSVTPSLPSTPLANSSILSNNDDMTDSNYQRNDNDDLYGTNCDGSMNSASRNATIDSNVLNDIGNMLANLTDELDAMLEEEKRAGLNDSE